MATYYLIGAKVCKCFSLALLFLCCLSLTACEKKAPLVELPTPVEDEPAVSEPFFDESGLVWRVEPTLEYDKIYYCSYCDMFNRNNQEGGSLDPKTGLLTDEYHGGHGRGGTIYLYDNKKNLYGIYSGDVDYSLELLSLDEFLNNSNRPNRLLAVEKIDSDLIAEYEGKVSHGLGNAHTGVFAIMYGSEFVTDFIYGYDAWAGGMSQNRGYIIAVKLDDKMGVLDTSGNIFIPFVFEDIVFIDEETAFAKINGKYGILELPEIAAATLNDVHTTMPYITSDNVNLREGPGTDYARITTVPQGSTVKVIDLRDGEWFLVEYEGQEGYMKADFLVEAYFDEDGNAQPKLIDVFADASNSRTYNSQLGVMESVTVNGSSIEIVRKDTSVSYYDRILSVDYISYVLRNPPIARTSDYVYDEFVPMLPVLGLLGAELYWAAEDGYYICRLAGHETKITPTKSDYIIDGVAQNLKYAPIYVDDQLMFSLMLLYQLTDYKYNAWANLSVRTNDSFDENTGYNFVINGNHVDFGEPPLIEGDYFDSFIAYTHIPFKQLLDALDISYTTNGNAIHCQINDRTVTVDRNNPMQRISGNPDDYGHFTNTEFYDYVSHGELYSNIRMVDFLFPECSVGYHPASRTFYVDSKPVDDYSRPQLTYYWSFSNYPKLFPAR